MALLPVFSSPILTGGGWPRVTDTMAPLLRDQAAAAVTEALSPVARTGQTQPRSFTPATLTPAQQRQIEQLKQIDQNVRAHEQAHIVAGRDLIRGGPSFTYTYGPDGKTYAIAGEVSIDTSRERQPRDNISKGQRIQAAALAPRDPSPQDYRTASIGEQMETQARIELARQQEQDAGTGRLEVGQAYAPKVFTTARINDYA
ncbi:MAG: hypothetical protein JSR19_02250 [Proteobacteria bacterium]|nr:hypothetical protein [Pseudomonadota bacterium]